TAAPALWFGALCVFLVAVNLRLPITAVSPVLDQVQRDEGVGSGAASLLVSIPVLCFALLPAAVVRFGRRFGLTSAVLVSLVVMVAGFGLRLVPDQVGLLAGTVVLGVAITAGNVLIPPLIKRDHSGSSGSLTGLYRLGLYFGAALGAGLPLPLPRGAGLAVDDHAVGGGAPGRAGRLGFPRPDLVGGPPAPFSQRGHARPCDRRFPLAASHGVGGHAGVRDPGTHILRCVRLVADHAG